MRVLVVEDHPTTRLGIRTALELEDIEVVGEAAGSDEAMRLLEELKPEIVLLDLRLKGENNGIGLCQLMKALPEPPRIVAYTAYNTADELADCREAGADGYVHKSEGSHRLLEAIKRVGDGEGQWLLGIEEETLAVQPRETLQGANLTDREFEVYELLLRRRTNPEISRELHIDSETTKTHVANVLAKLGYRSRRDLS